MIWQGNVRNLPKGIAGITVHDDGDIDTSISNVDMLFPLGIGAAVGADTAGVHALVFNDVFGGPSF